jgi:hypothetical protein
MVLSNLNLLLPTRSHGQIDSIYFDFSNAFDIFPRELFHHKLSNYGLYSGYINWFFSYLTNRQSRVRYSGIFPTPFSCTQA